MINEKFITNNCRKYNFHGRYLVETNSPIIFVTNETNKLTPIPINVSSGKFLLELNGDIYIEKNYVLHAIFWDNYREFHLEHLGIEHAVIETAENTKPLVQLSLSYEAPLPSDIPILFMNEVEASYNSPLIETDYWLELKFSKFGRFDKFETAYSSHVEAFPFGLAPNKIDESDMYYFDWDNGLMAFNPEVDRYGKVEYGDRTGLLENIHFCTGNVGQVNYYGVPMLLSNLISVDNRYIGIDIRPSTSIDNNRTLCGKGHLWWNNTIITPVDNRFHISGLIDVFRISEKEDFYHAQWDTDNIENPSFLYRGNRSGNYSKNVNTTINAGDFVCFDTATNELVIKQSVTSSDCILFFHNGQTLRAFEPDFSTGLISEQNLINEV